MRISAARASCSRSRPFCPDLNLAKLAVLKRRRCAWRVAFSFALIRLSPIRHSPVTDLGYPYACFSKFGRRPFRWLTSGGPGSQDAEHARSPQMACSARPEASFAASAGIPATGGGASWPRCPPRHYRKSAFRFPQSRVGGVLLGARDAHHKRHKQLERDRLCLDRDHAPALR